MHGISDQRVVSPDRRSSDRGNDPPFEWSGRRIVGTSPALQAAQRHVLRVAPTHAPVLILGETGSGKELFAQAVHDLSRRHDRALVRVDCASLTPSLIESELFGCVRGAFTGAMERRVGRIELAHQSTLFLDEIGELPLEQQAKLLRVLQEGEFEPLGATRTVKVDIRVIAATHRRLADEVKTGRFRADLYHRLAAFPIHVPPLRDRLEDLPLLVEHMVCDQAQQLGRSFGPVPTAIVDRLRRHAWPGNVRELQNVVQAACILARGPMLLGADVEALLSKEPEVGSPSPPAAPQELQTLREVERAHIAAVLQRCRGIIEGPAGAAAILGLPPSTLRFRIRKLGIGTARAASHSAYRAEQVATDP